MTACLENLEMSVNLTAVREMSGNWPKVREMLELLGKSLVKAWCFFAILCRVIVVLLQLYFITFAVT